MEYRESDKRAKNYSSCVGKEKEISHKNRILVPKQLKLFLNICGIRILQIQKQQDATYWNHFVGEGCFY